MKELPINQIICGDCLGVMKQMPNECVDMVLCSPPYWGLRDYGIEQIFGGDKDCEHEWDVVAGLRKATPGDLPSSKSIIAAKRTNAENRPGKDSNRCLKCQAWKGQLGLEPTPELYIEHLTEIFNEAKRVLKKEGTFFLNMGDTYNSQGSRNKNYDNFHHQGQDEISKKVGSIYQNNIPNKCLLMIPERLAWSLIQNGWILRNKIIWYKPNSMPSSVKDRFSNTYEFVYMFSKNQRYFFDLDSVREPLAKESFDRYKYPFNAFGDGLESGQISRKNPTKRINLTKHDQAVGRIGDFSYTDPLHTKENHPLGKNPGDVIEAGAETRTMGAIIGSGGGVKIPGGKGWTGHPKGGGAACQKDPRWCPSEGKNPGDFFEINTQPFPEAHFAVFPEKLCEKPIKAGCPEDGIVLDPFAGAGTALYVAKQLRRRFIGIDIKQEYCDMAEKRLAQGVL